MYYAYQEVKMNGSNIEAKGNFDLFTASKEMNEVFPSSSVDSDRYAHVIIHKIHSHLEEDISDYVFQTLQMIASQCEENITWDKHQKLIKLAGDVVKDFEQGHYRRGFFAKVFDTLLVAFDLRHSEQEIRILHRSIKAPSLGDRLASDHIETLIQAHRSPELSSESYDKVALTGVFFENAYKELLAQNGEALSCLKEPQLSIFKAHLKEKAIKDIYRNELPKRIQERCYNPAIIPHEIDKILGPVKKISRMKLNDKNLNSCLEDEVNQYAKYLNAHQLKYIKTDVVETIKLYLEVYPERNCRDAFILGRDLIRFAVYQEIFDKSSFSGSDHGSKHIHNNIDNAQSLHDNMKMSVDYTKKDMLIERLIHFYHDVGYTVGLAGKSFSCCKDHPLIGAKLIEENQSYFEHYLDKESFEVLWNGVLLHAIALPDLTPDARPVNGIYPGMVRAITSISDACAVTFDRKTQEFWEQPTTLIALVRLRLFLTKYPQYISKLSPIGKDEWELLDKENPLDVLAHDVFQHTKHILFKAVEKSNVPSNKKELFRQAILQQFNSFTTATTLGQFGGMLVGVSSFKNEEMGPDAPKFYPQFDMAPSIIYGTLHDLFGPDIAQASFKKLVDEFSGDLGALAHEIDQVAGKNVHHQNKASQGIKTGNARFKIVKQREIAAENIHLNEMQRSLQQVIQKVDSVVRSQYMSLAQKNRVMRDFISFRQGTLKECRSFPDFISEFILPNLDIHLAVEAAKDIQYLTNAVKENVFKDINQADALWRECFEFLNKSSYDPIRVEVDKFKGELEKLRMALNEDKSADKVQKLKEGLVNNIQKKKNIDVEAFKNDLDEVLKGVLSHSEVFAKAEKRFIDVENALKLVLVSEEEYRFMRGKKALVNKSECLEEVLG